MSAGRFVPGSLLLDDISFGVLCAVVGLNSLAIHLLTPEGLGLNFGLGLVVPEMFLEVTHVNCLDLILSQKLQNNR